MKTIKLSLLAAMLISLAACGNNEGGSSTPIDSTNNTGAAPVDYQSGTPDQTVSPGTVQRDANTSDTTGDASRSMSQPNGNGTNTSNTTDATTTSGSANNGDADGDRKR